MKHKQIIIGIVIALLCSPIECKGNAEEELLKEVPAVIELAVASYKALDEVFTRMGELGDWPEDEVKRAQELAMAAYQKAKMLRSKYGESDLAAIPEGRRMLSESRYMAMMYYAKIREKVGELVKRGILTFTDSGPKTWGFFIVTMSKQAKHADTIKRVCGFWEEMDQCFEKIVTLLNEVNNAESAAATYDEVLSLYEKTKTLQGIVYEYTEDDPDWGDSALIIRAYDRLLDRIKNELIPAEQRLKNADYYGIQKYRDITLIDRPNNMPINLEE